MTRVVNYNLVHIRPDHLLVKETLNQHIHIFSKCLSKGIKKQRFYTQNVQLFCVVKQSSDYIDYIALTSPVYMKLGWRNMSSHNHMNIYLPWLVELLLL